MRVFSLTYNNAYILLNVFPFSPTSVKSINLYLQFTASVTIKIVSRCIPGTKGRHNDPGDFILLINTVTTLSKACFDSFFVTIWCYCNSYRNTAIVANTQFQTHFKIHSGHCNYLGWLFIYLSLMCTSISRMPFIISACYCLLLVLHATKMKWRQLYNYYILKDNKKAAAALLMLYSGYFIATSCLSCFVNEEIVLMRYEKHTSENKANSNPVSAVIGCSSLSHHCNLTAY